MSIQTSRARPLGGRAFLIVGVGLFVAKFAIDHAVAGYGFGRPWSLIDYLIPTRAHTIASLPADDRTFYLTMCGITVPFVVIGLLVTTRRLRDAGLPLAMLVLFFLPICNLLFFATLGVVPSRRANGRTSDSVAKTSLSVPGATPREGVDCVNAPSNADRDVGATENPIDYATPTTARLTRAWPADARLSFVCATLLAGLLAPLFVALGALFLRQYGWGLFVGMPFVVGMVAALLHGIGGPRRAWSSIAVAFAAGGVGFAGTVLFALEGVVCLIMLVPLAAPIVLVGGLAGHAIATAARGSVRAVALALVGLLPLVMGAERVDRQPARVFVATTRVEVAAPPDVVWRNVVSFGEIARPSGWFFATGVAYPIRARIEGVGVGAIRYCEFSTGPFVEPITAWDAPRLLKFDVTHNPPPLREWSPFRVAPPHLEDFLKSHGGEFRLIDLGDGRTRVEGTTWYEHGMWPEAYWSVWSDYVIHQIHGRVLEHVRQLSEAEGDRVFAAPIDSRRLARHADR